HFPVIFLSSSGALRDLHSFPTRRSSDLPDGVYALRYGLAALIASVVYVTLFFALAILLRNAVIAGLVYALMWEGTLAAWVPGARSEEHTSELQSRENLVCCLLLEKKKHT